MTQDQVSLQAERLRLWSDFNNAWLGLFQKQIDSLEQGAPRMTRLMPSSTISNMANKLVALCDVVEKHGLVDYQYGIEEARIMNGTSHTFQTNARKLMNMDYSSH